jgi:hypothetical protein
LALNKKIWHKIAVFLQYFGPLSPYSFEKVQSMAIASSKMDLFDYNPSKRSKFLFRLGGRYA